ncbi:hypothetical protein [Nocardia sp. NPDC004860]|uniref:hypothetical protein n=1 Tax=Nocardia sp. NPDC004860 TaxID=3154557 RepID=UPI0033B514E9
MTAGFNPGPNGGYTAKITGLRADDKCDIWFGKNNVLNSKNSGEGNGGPDGTLHFGPYDVDSPEYDMVVIRCFDKNNNPLLTDYSATFDRKHKILSQDGWLPVKNAAAPLGTTWTMEDSGGAPHPWVGTWTRVSPTSDTWNWTAKNDQLPGTPTSSGQMKFTWDGNTLRIHRTTNGSSQTCDYVGTPTGTANTDLFDGFTGTCNCSNSGIANMKWHTTSIR